MPSILFVCTANQFRSPIAAACFSKLITRENITKRWRVESAGTWARNGMGPAAVALQVAQTLRLTGLEDHLTRRVDQGLLEGFDLVIAMERGHKEALCIEFPALCGRVYLLSEIVDGDQYDIPDPGGAGGTPTEVGKLLAGLLDRGKEKILNLAESLAKE